MNLGIFLDCENPECITERDDLLHEVDKLEQKIYRLQNHIMGADKEITELKAKLNEKEKPL